MDDCWSVWWVRIGIPYNNPESGVTTHCRLNMLLFLQSKIQFVPLCIHHWPDILPVMLIVGPSILERLFLDFYNVRLQSIQAQVSPSLDGRESSKRLAVTTKWCVAQPKLKQFAPNRPPEAQRWTNLKVNASFRYAQGEYIGLRIGSVFPESVRMAVRWSAVHPISLFPEVTSFGSAELRAGFEFLPL